MTTVSGDPTGAPELVADAGALARLAEALEHEALVAIDTEAASFHRYSDRIYLLQCSTRARTWLVDPIAVPDLRPLGDVLSSPRVETILHDADYDLRLLRRDHGLGIARLFDTRVAAQLLNEPGIGLAALLEKHLGIALDKKFQRADWSQRPLSAGMIAYAAADTAHLAALRDVLRERLEGRGRLAWAEEEFELQRVVEWAPPEEQEPGWLRLKGAKSLKGPPLAVLRELYEWRDRAAQRLDRAPFRVLNNDVLLALATAAPTTAEALRGVKGVSTDFAERRGKELLATIARGLGRPDAATLRPPRGRRPPANPALDARLERLKAARNAMATALDLAPGVVCPNGTLEAIATAAPTTRDALAAVPGIRRWQVTVCGDALLGAVADPTSPGTP